MTNVRVKRGAKQHYIHKSDDIPRPIHLGTDARTARKRLIKLKNAHSRHAKLNTDIEKLQYKLKRTAEHGRPIHHRLAEVKHKFYRQKMYDKMISEGKPENRTEQIAILATLAVCSIIFLGYLLGEPMITGSSVIGADINTKDLAASEFTTTVIVFLTVIAIALTALHLKFHMKNRKHAAYKHQ